MLITLDLDGVLIVNPFRKGVFPEVVATLGPTLVDRGETTESEVRRHISQLVTDEVRRRLYAGRFTSAYDWDEIYTTVARAIGSSASFDVAKMVRKYCSVPDIVSFHHPGVPDVLERLSRLGHTLVALTNGYRSYQLPVLERLDIARFFAAIVTPDQTGYAKPQPEIFAEARAFGPSGAPALHVGDTLTHDILGAKRAGFQSVWVYDDLPREALDVHPGERLSSTPKLAGLLKTKLEREYCADAYDAAGVEAYTPDFVVADVTELPALID